MPLELAAQALQLAAGQDGLAVLALQVVLLLHQLRLLLLQDLHLLLGVTVLLQLGQGSKGHRCSRAEQGNAPCAKEETRESWKCSEGGQELYNAKDASFERSRTATEPKDPQAGPVSFLNSRPGESERPAHPEPYLCPEPALVKHGSDSACAVGRKVPAAAQ